MIQRCVIESDAAAQESDPFSLVKVGRWKAGTHAAGNSFHDASCQEVSVATKLVLCTRRKTGLVSEGAI